MSRTNSLWPLGLVAALALSLFGCPPPPPPVPDASTEEDAGFDAGEEDAGIDAGPEDAGWSCVRDDDCAVFNQGLRCDEATGVCIGSRGCNDDTNCDSVDEADYCYHYGLQCRCVQEENDAGFSGVCRRRHAVCDQCTSDVECGNSGVFDPPGACRALSGDTTGKKYCLQGMQGSTCGCGMINDGQGYCKPQTNDCSKVGCTEDKNCPGGSVCNKNACLCEPRCRWDFALKSEASPGCPPGKTCWVDTANLNPDSLFYGAGRCRPPCNGNTDCTDIVSNPFGGTNLKCAGEQLSGGGLSPKRCRANGACMDNLECPELPPDSIYLGYCDRGAFTCNADCRLGIDPVTGQGYRDCRSGYKCEAGDAGANVCVLKTCVEMGGARMACARGEYCCGEDKNGDSLADPCPPANQRDLNGCYTAPSPPFCFECQSSADCMSYTPPAWLGTCANGSKSPACSPLPNLCVNAGKRPDGSDGIAVCAPSTWNDTTTDSNGVSKAIRGCPATYAAVSFKPKFTAADDPDDCKSNADCSVGQDGGGICDADLATFLPDGGHPLSCKCTIPGAPAQCPNTTDGGITSVCKFGIAIPTVCIQSVVCLASPGVVYKDAGAPTYGCGL
ncbi:MAG: hypothetical protein ACYC8T_02830 [Myxococcaceae bacterium]